jgi:SAM-dependent methyltransferase
LLPHPEDLSPVLLDLGLGADALRTGAARVASPADAPAAARALPGAATLFVAVAGAPEPPAAADLVRLRDALWPACHVIGLFENGPEGLRRHGVAGRARLAAVMRWQGVLLAARARAHVLSPEVTATKFDANAAGWNGEPGSPGYAHFRWMRRLVGTFAPIPDGARVLDFGCGAGWVGIEAARSARDVELCSFDPSPAMVRRAGANAAAAGIARHAARVGFGEDPPFPAAGEPAFDVVISSGVLSFAPDLDRLVAGLARAVKPGGALVVGDLNPSSLGMRHRRRTRALLPVRELNAQSPDAIRARLEAAGFRHARTSGYQLTFPVPQAMHASEAHLRGALSPLLLLANRAAASLARRLGDPCPALFDSWVSSYAFARR